ncbi:hypothetical protein [Actinacidiphila sp. ITFR-21]|uniref:hypothetical protein n=1 Tax=Actinacidiphila sp. ITFR-21 TaxID=3075199 RepID=UPI0028896F38|nr:hypothetical protein [Streptomyces sp. ITFR-21]WNI17316.1 hypothetical protein RLT57_18535 [Streptomyces sp. ITFR-21]
MPDDHADWYEPDVGRMIEPRQRWVLACPVLKLDTLTNSHRLEHAPHGVIVFYGTQVPAGSGAPARIQTCLNFAEQFAEQMSHVLNMLELSSRAEERDDDQPRNDS